MLDGNTAQRNIDTIPLKVDKTNSLDLWKIVVVLLNCYIGLGPVRNDRHMRCGVLYVTAVNWIACLITYYCFYLLCLVMKIQKTFMFETSWEAHYKLPVIMSIGVFVPCIGFLSFYFTNISNLWTSLIAIIWPGAPSYATDHYTVALVISLTIYIPLYLIQNIKYIYISSLVKMVLLVFILGFDVYWIIYFVSKNGFDPKHEISWIINFEQPYFSCIVEFISTYSNFMFFFYVLKEMSNLTFQRAKKVTQLSMGLFALINQIFLFAGYFTVFNDRGEGVLFEYLPQDNIIVAISYVLFFILMIISNACLLNPGRESALAFIVILPKYPSFVWFAMGMIIILAAILIGRLAGIYQTILQTVQNMVALLMQFAIPALLIFKIRKSVHKIHFVGAIILFIVGVGATCYFLITTILG